VHGLAGAGRRLSGPGLDLFSAGLQFVPPPHRRPSFIRDPVSRASNRRPQIRAPARAQTGPTRRTRRGLCSAREAGTTEGCWDARLLRRSSGSRFGLMSKPPSRTYSVVRFFRHVAISSCHDRRKSA
jgi:hypothetical protein